MGILKNIWNTIFGKSKKEQELNSESIKQASMKVVYKKETANTIGDCSLVDTQPDKSNPNFNPSNHGVCIFPVTPIPNGDDFFVSDDLIEKENKIDADYSFVVEKQIKKRTKNVIGQNTLNEIKEYLLTYGSLDVLTCEQKFKVKSLHNFIWYLRKEGFKIKTDKVGLHNELGQKVEVTNYRLISKK